MSVGIGADDILAGPIVRRVEPSLASVWIALRKPASVRLDVFRGLGTRATLGTAVAARLAPPAPSAPRGLPPDQHTLAIGKWLHVAVATFEPQPPGRLEWGTVYSYDLRLLADDGGPEVGFDEMDLLRDRKVVGWFGEQDTLALGYQPGWLPSFLLPAAHPMDLRLTQGSCRWVNGFGRDAMPIVDDLLRDHIGDPTQRIQQMWLTGDQIYADAGAPELIRACTTIGTMLLAGEDRVVEHIEVQEDPAGPEAPYRFPMDQHHFPAGRRHVFMNRIGGFTSSKQDSHAIGFGEYAATYLASWHTAVWPDLTDMLEERWNRVTDYQQARDQLDALIKTVPDSVSRPKQFERLRDLYEAWRLLPPDAIAIDSNLTESDHWEIWDEVPGDFGDESWQRYWENAAAAPGTDGAKCLAYSRPPWPDAMPVTPESPGKRLLARMLTPAWWAGDETFRVALKNLSATGIDSRPTSDLARERLHLMKRFHEDVPRVRRALANVATYMTFDDHEVCDDWNITAGWVTKVRGNVLGRNVLRNGIAAYAVFQGWGNDPRAFIEPTGAGQRVLRSIASMFLDESGVPRPDGPPRAVADALDLHFNNRPLTEPEPSLADRMAWFYRYDGPGYELIALDSRTWRGYERDADPTIGQPFTNEANAPLLTEEGLALQIPADPAPGVAEDGLCFVIAAAPVLGYPPVESIAQPLLNINDMAKPPSHGRWAKTREAYRLGRVNYDPEHWGLMPHLFERVLERLSTRRRVLFMSGDVHYSCTLEMTYWRREGSQYRASRFIQLTSSSFRTAHEFAFIFSIDLLQQISKELAAPIVKLGWHKGLTGGPDDLDPVAPPATGPQTRFNDRVRYLLQNDPIVLAPSALPEGTQQRRPPDWAYRRRLVEDVRPDDERLAGLLPPVLLPPSAGWPQMAQSVANRVSWHVEHVPDRRWVWWTNLTTIDFAVVDGVPVVRHSTHTFDLADPRSPAKPYVVAIAPLIAPPTDTLPTVPTEVTEDL